MRQLQTGVRWAGHRRSRVLVVAMVTLSMWTGAGLVASAASNDPPAPAGRFTMAPVEGGVLRMDTDTGTVSHCARKGTAWACETIADDYKALQQENEVLKKELKDLRRDSKEGGTHAKSDRKLELPSEEEIDKAISQIEKYLRKFKGLIEKHQGPDVPGRT